MRTGFAHSSGRYVDDGCNLTANGQSQANDVQGVLDYLVRQPWVDRSRLLVAGQSHGGLTTLAFDGNQLSYIIGGGAGTVIQCGQAGQPACPTVPEPGTMPLLMLAALGLAVPRLRRRFAKSA